MLARCTEANEKLCEIVWYWRSLQASSKRFECAEFWAATLCYERRWLSRIESLIFCLLKLSATIRCKSIAREWDISYRTRCAACPLRPNMPKEVCYRSIEDRFALIWRWVGRASDPPYQHQTAILVDRFRAASNTRLHILPWSIGQRPSRWLSDLGTILAKGLRQNRWLSKLRAFAISRSGIVCVVAVTASCMWPVISLSVVFDGF